MEPCEVHPLCIPAAGGVLSPVTMAAIVSSSLVVKKTVGGGAAAASGGAAEAEALRQLPLLFCPGPRSMPHDPRLGWAPAAADSRAGLITVNRGDKHLQHTDCQRTLTEGLST